VIAIVDYGMGNLRSVERAFASIGAPARITRDHDELRAAEKIVLPGVGAFGLAMERLHNFGLVDVLNEQVLENGKPLLGICLGMQLVCRESYEHGHHEGLGWIPATLRRLEPGDGLRVPHVGWNDTRVRREGLVTEGTHYYVHSYYADCDNEDDVAAVFPYGSEFTAAIERDNIVATQFHPEKSQVDGLALLRRFVAC
jgi:glutamine amidotransferase